jgi:hypothetical protein
VSTDRCGRHRWWLWFVEQTLKPVRHVR